MTYATLMVHVEPGAGANPRLDLALELANRFNALLIGFAAENIRPLMADPMGGGTGGAAAYAAFMEPEQERIEARLRTAEVRFQAVMSSNTGCRCAWRAFVETPLDALTREARAADLLILGREAAVPDTDALQFPDPGATLLTAGRPVLLVPPSIASVTARRIIVAWKDTREARRAVSDALPFLRRAEEVLVLEVCEEGHERADLQLQLGDVVAYLERHGVRARKEARDRRYRSVVDELLLASEQTGSDLIVAGGFGRGRIREWVFGGVTRDLLRYSPKPCLLSH